MKNSIQSIERAFQILEAVHRRQAGVAVGELATETGLYTSTVSRIVSTLEHLGALGRVDGKLIIGDQIFSLANQASQIEQIVGIATPILRELAAETQEAIGLTRIDGPDCEIFYQIPGTHHIQIKDWTGERFPLHVTSTGKLYLAQLDQTELATYFAEPRYKLASATRTTEVDLRAKFPEICQTGLAWTVDELEDGLTSIASAVTDKHGRFLAGVYLSAPSYRIEKSKTDLANKIHQAAVEISRRLP